MRDVPSPAPIRLRRLARPRPRPHRGWGGVRKRYGIRHGYLLSKPVPKDGMGELLD